MDRAAIAVIALYCVSALSGVISRRRHGIFSDNLALVGLRLRSSSRAILFSISVAATRRAASRWSGLIVIVLLVFLTWVDEAHDVRSPRVRGRGNAEAARRAGINVKVIRWWVFGISGAMAGLGGVLFASRLSSVDLNAGGGTILLDAIAAAVIGGTSLFGGRGEIKSALLGALIIASIANGMSLLGYSSATKFIVTGIILLAAVTLDTVSRRRLVASGR